MAISFNSLGNFGRIGNQMFQLASLLGIAANSNLDIIIPPKELFGANDLKVKLSDNNIFNTFRLQNFNIGITNFHTLEERFFHFDDELFNNCPDNINLNGYYQSEKYFKKVEHEVRRIFTFIDSIQDPCEKQFRSSFNTDVISLHVRRGDYLNYSHHPIQSNSYYENALKHLDDSLPVMVFSDDIEWCKEQKLFSSDRFIISTDNSTGTDLCLMSLCSYHIIANSSFSWWGAWLAKSKKVIAPSPWFGLPLTHDTKDLYLENWIVLQMC